MILQLRRFGIDAADKMVVRAVEKHQHVFQMFALAGDTQRMNHRLLMGIALAQPQPVDGHRKLAFLALDVARLQAGEFRKHLRGHRREDRDAENADQHRHGQRRQQEIPGRNARRPRRHKFARTRQAHKGEDAAQQDGEGQHLLAQIGQLQHRHADRGRPGRHIVPGGSVEQVHKVDGESQHQKDGIDHHHADQELHRQIAVKSPGPTHASAPIVAFARQRASSGPGAYPASTAMAPAAPNAGSR